MTGRVHVPTADGKAAAPVHSARAVHSVVLAGCLVLVVGALPAIRFAESPVPTERTTADAAPFVVAPVAGNTLWDAPILLPGDVRDVVGLGSTVIAITPDDVWPAWALDDGRWTKLRGIPRGPSFGSQVGVKREHGFSVVGVADGRSVIYDYRTDGAFAGARTVRDIQAGALAAVGDGVALFDAHRPEGRLVTTTITDIAPPGIVVEAASGAGWLLVLTDDGIVHGIQDPSRSEWRRLGEGFVGLRAAENVVAVGENATVGLHHLAVDGSLVRMDGAPYGPTVVWGTAVAVHDWSSGSVWMSGGEDRWERLPLWTDAGFRATFRGMVPGTDVPTVAGVGPAGEAALWRVSP